MINNVKIIKKYKSLGLFEWKNVPQLAVVCGLNGSGKTQLLEIINTGAQGGNQPSQITSPTPLKGKVKYVSAYHQFGQLDNNLGTTQQIEARITQIVTYAKSAQKNNQQFNDLIKHIEDEAGSSITSLEPSEIESLVPPNYVWFLDDGFNNQYISELFKAYQNKVDSTKLEYYDKEEKPTVDQIYSLIGFPPPWLVINEIFDKYGFNYHVVVPEGRNLHYKPDFIDKNDNSNRVQFNSLSSGEKIIVSLVLWAFNQKLGEKNAVFLLDEFDAHLNPSMSRMFIEIVREKLVGEYGIQVVMTTHSPSTVAYLDEEELFWMERGQEICKGNKREVISNLSEGIMTYDEASSLLFALVQSSKKLVVFTEGKTDIDHILNAKEKLEVTLDFDIHTCNGANKLQQFLIGCPEGLFGDKKVIGIFDYDPEGINCVNKIKKESSFVKISEGLYKSNSNEAVYAVILPTPDLNFEKYKYCPIEFLFSKDVLEGYQLIEKRNIKEINSINSDSEQLGSNDYDQKDDLWFYKVTDRVTSKTSFTQSAKSLEKDQFGNFQPLFDKLNEI